MAYKYKITNLAMHKKALIVEYLCKLTGSKSAAKKLNNAYLRIIGLVKENPFLFGISTTAGLEEREIKTFHVMNYAVLYIVEDDSFTVLHIFHQRQCYARLI